MPVYHFVDDSRDETLFSMWQVGDVTRQIFLVIGRHMYFFIAQVFLGWRKFMNVILASDDMDVWKYEKFVMSH